MVEQSNDRPSWWLCGLIGAGYPLLFPLMVLVLCWPLLLWDKSTDWSDFVVTCGLIACCGFLVGLTFGILRPVAERLGDFGHVLVGMLVINVLVFSCLYCFDRPTFMGLTPGREWWLAGACLAGGAIGLLATGRWRTENNADWLENRRSRLASAMERSLAASQPETSIESSPSEKESQDTQKWWRSLRIPLFRFGDDERPISWWEYPFYVLYGPVFVAAFGAALVVSLVFSPVFALYRERKVWVHDLSSEHQRKLIARYRAVLSHATFWRRVKRALTQRTLIAQRRRRSWKAEKLMASLAVRTFAGLPLPVLQAAEGAPRPLNEGPRLFVIEKHPTTKRWAILEDDGHSAWLSITEPGTSKIVADCHVYNHEPPSMRISQSLGFQHRPPIDRSSASDHCCRPDLSADRVSLEWSPAGKAAFVCIDDEAVAMLLVGSLRGYSRSISFVSEYGEAWNDRAFLCCIMDED